MFNDNALNSMLHLSVPKWTCVFILQLIITFKPRRDNHTVFGKPGKRQMSKKNVYECLNGNVNPLSLIYSNWPIYLEIKFCQFRERSIGNWSCRLIRTGSFFYLSRRQRNFLESFNKLLLAGESRYIFPGCIKIPSFQSPL